MQWHADIFREHNIIEPLFTSDNAEGLGNSILMGALQVGVYSALWPHCQSAHVQFVFAVTSHNALSTLTTDRQL